MTKLTPEVGKTYVARNGDLVTINSDDGTGTYRLNGSNFVSYTADGSEWEHAESDLDLITEHVVEEAPPLPAFAVGQLWRTRGGAQVTIVSIESARAYPVQASDERQRDLSGCWLSANVPDDHDLIAFIHAAPEAPPALAPAIDEPMEHVGVNLPMEPPAAVDAPNFKVGQTWLTRDGKRVVIVSISGSMEFPIYGDDELRRDAHGCWLKPSYPDEDDLINLVDDAPTPDAEGIADCLIAKAAAYIAGTASGDADTPAASTVTYTEQTDESMLIDTLIVEIAPQLVHGSAGWANTMMDQIQVVIARRRAMLTPTTA